MSEGSGFGEEPQGEVREAERVPAWFRIVLPIGALAAAFLYWDDGNRTVEPPAERRPAVAQTQTDLPESAYPSVTWDGKTIRRGDRVRIARWAGTFKPEETGYPRQVHAAANQTGVVIGGEKRKDTLHLDIDAAEPIQIVRVRWAPQRWKVSGQDQWIALPAFYATIHVQYLEVTP